MREIFRDNQVYSRSIYINGRPRRRYGLFRFMFDATMCLLTCGLWFIWIFVREMRGR